MVFWNMPILMLFTKKAYILSFLLIGKECRAREKITCVK